MGTLRCPWVDLTRRPLGQREDIGPQQRERSDAELLTRYFEVHFDDVAEELAASGPEAPGSEPGTVGQRQMAAALLRQFVRGLIGLRGGAVDKDAVLDVASSMAGLTPFQRDMLKARALAVLNRADGRPDVPDVVRGASARVRSQAASLAEAMASVAEEVEALAEAAAPLAEEAEETAPLADEATPLADEATPLADEATPLADEAEESTPLAEEERLLRELQEEAVGGKPAPAPEAERVQTSVSQVSKGQKRGLGPLRPTLTPAPPVGMNGAASTSAVASVLSAMVLKGLEQVGADLCQIFMLDDDIHLTLRAESPAESGPVTGPRILSTRDGFTARVVGAGGPVALESEQQLDGSEITWLERGLNALAAVSVGVPGDPGSGILVAGRTSTRRFGDDDLEHLASLASEVTLAIASADLVARAEELAVLKERMKLAREIHDGLASDLSAVVALFKYHEHRRELDPNDADGLLVQMRELVEQSLANARDILATLRPRQQIPTRLAEAVRRHVEDFSQTYGITAITRVLGTDDGLDEEERDSLFQVLREALTNVRRHSEAGTINIALDLRHRPFSLVVEDDGIGIDLEALEEKVGSFGLMGIRERAELLGGTVEISQSPMGGARVAFYGPPIPLGGT